MVVVVDHVSALAATAELLVRNLPPALVLSLSLTLTIPPNVNVNIKTFGQSPEYAKAASILAADGSSFKLAKIDSTVEKTLSKEFGIRGFPTMKYFVKGKLKSDYSGTRDAAGIVAWAKKKSASVNNKDKDKDKDKDVKEEKGKK